MRVVLGYHTFASFAGSEAYLLTVAEQLERLGHEALVYTLEPGEMAAVAEERGVRVARALHELPPDCEAVLAQDGATAYQLADRYPEAPAVFVVHSTEFPAQTPPQLPRACAAAVVMNDRVRTHVERLAECPEVVRLRQPVDFSRFLPLASTRREARRVAVFGNQLDGPRYDAVASACAELGLEVDRLGHRGQATASPEQRLALADIVVGIGRCVVEAMAAGKAAYVYGVAGGDGWVTPESYPVLEADGFSGRATDAHIDAERLRADLGDFRLELSLHNRDLAYRHHHAAIHAGEVVALWERLGAAPGRIDGPLHELARLIRLQAQAESRGAALGGEAQRLRHELDRLRGEYEDELGRLHAELARVRTRLDALTVTRRYRLAAALAKPLEELRRLRGVVTRGRS